MPNSSDQVEDIFESTFSTTVEPVVTEPVPTVVVQSRPSRRRFILVIAICLIVLLLLGGSGFGVWLWLQRPPENTNVNTTIVNDAVIIVPENTNSAPVNTTPTFADVDHDGLSDDEELVENTNPKKKDTDEDGLSDREEVRVYNTDPRNPDTDGDGYTDGDEVANFYHPNSPDPTQRLFDLPQ